MGRNWTGVRTIEASKKLDIRILFKSGGIIKGGKTKGNIEWEDGSFAAFESCYTKKDQYFKIGYTLIDNRRNTNRSYHYKIKIKTIKSNLGIGEIPYLICPLTGKRAKVLIMAYGYDKYAHRTAYGSIIGTKPLYYRVQQVSKNDYHYSRYFKLKNQYEELNSQLNENANVKRIYNGTPTKNMVKLGWLSIKMNYHSIEKNKLFISEYNKLINGNKSNN